MPHEFEEGWFHRTPAWHQLGEIRDVRPETWDEARDGYLKWEPEVQPLYASGGNLPISGKEWFKPVEGWNLITRSDNGHVLSVQEDSYAVIGNTEFGGIIEYAMGVDIPGMPKLQFDALCVLKGGRMVVVTLMLESAIRIPKDPSALYPFMTFWTRHDGQGGAKGGASTIRVVCANTQAMAENQMDTHGFVFNIRHTKNWATKLEEARTSIVTAIGNVGAWTEMAEHLAKSAVNDEAVTWFLDRWLPYSTDMTALQKDNVSRKRGAFRAVYNSETCNQIAGTSWGVLQAAVEAADHLFPAHNLETRTARILVHGDDYKSRALRLVKSMSKS